MSDLSHKIKILNKSGIKKLSKSIDIEYAEYLPVI